MFSKIELLGIIYELIFEDCYKPWEEDNWYFKDAPLELDPEYWQSIKEDWIKGEHCGDCIKAPCTCTVCYWQQLLQDGCDIALGLAKESCDFFKDPYIEALKSSGENDEIRKWIWEKIKKEFDILSGEYMIQVQWKLKTQDPSLLH